MKLYKILAILGAIITIHFTDHISTFSFNEEKLDIYGSLFGIILILAAFYLKYKERKKEF